MSKIILIVVFVSCTFLIGANMQKKSEETAIMSIVPVAAHQWDQNVPESPFMAPEIEEATQNPAQRSGKWVRALVTAYTPWDAIDSNSGYQDGYTATMVDTTSGNPNDMYGVAADPRAIPYGTEIYVPDYWESLQANQNSIPSRIIVDDTGGMMRRNWDRGVLHIDVRYRTTEAAKKWGKRWVTIFIYD